MIYKIKHNMVGATFENKEPRFVDDLYLLSYIDRFSVIAKRDCGERLTYADRFCELLDVVDRASFKNYLYDESDEPLVLKTDVGTAIVNKYLVLSTLLVAVSFICDERRGEVLEVALRRKGKDLCLPEHYKSDKGRIANSKRINSDIDVVLNNFRDLLERPYITTGVSPRVTVENFKNAVACLSALSGCDVELEISEQLICDDCFDLCTFKGFLLSMLMLARRSSTRRRACVEITSCSEGVSVRVKFETNEERRVLAFPEIHLIYELADRNNMLFEASLENGMINVRFCPTRKDWSVIGLKAPVDFDWDS